MDGLTAFGLLATFTAERLAFELRAVTRLAEVLPRRSFIVHSSASATAGMGS